MKNRDALMKEIYTYIAMTVCAFVHAYNHTYMLIHATCIYYIILIIQAVSGAPPAVPCRDQRHTRVRH